MDNFGVSFLPQGPNDPNSPQPGGSSPQERVQQAVRVLSLRLPRFQQGGAQIAPAPLLQGTGAQGSPFGHPGVAQTQQQQMMAPSMGQPPMGGSPMGQGGNPQIQAFMQLAGLFRQGAPTQPRIIPGVGGGSPDVPAPPTQTEWGGQNGVLRDVSPVTPPNRTGYGDQLSRDWMTQFRG